MKEQLQHAIGDNSKQTLATVDAISVSTVIGTLMGLLPTMAALFTIVWTVIRIYETDTVQGWLRKRKQRKDK